MDSKIKDHVTNTATAIVVIALAILLAALILWPALYIFRNLPT